MGTNKRYWKGLSELHNSPEFQKNANNEFAEELPLEGLLNDEKSSSNTSRRDFLKVMGFTTTAAVLASCETPVIKSIPYVVKPEEITPGIANFYASTFYDGHDYASVLVKTREGRPIKIEGNTLAKATNGGTSSRVQSSVLSLYDGARLTGPTAKKAAATWANADAAIAKQLADVAASGKEIAILSSTIISPSTKAVIAEFTSKYPTAKVYQYDSVSYSALRNANEKVWGKKVVSSYDFSKANVVVGIACDFLGNWLGNDTEFAVQYTANRKVSKENREMNKHYHFESNLSLTGANADERYMIKPSEIGKAVVALYNAVANATGNSPAGSGKVANEEANKAIAKIAKELADNKGKSLVVCGLNDTDVQVMVNGINKMLDNYGKSVDVDMHSNLKQGDDAQFKMLVDNMNGGKTGAIITYNCNPIYTAPSKMNFATAYAKVGLKISFAQVLDETAQKADYVCPDNNWLESWGDANPKRGQYSLQQPTISQLFVAPRFEGTRQAQDSLLKWSGVKTDYLTYLQAYWQNHVFPMQGKYGNFYDFWAHTLHDGVLKVNVAKAAAIVDMPLVPMAKDSSGKPLLTGVATVLEALVSDTTKAAPKVEEKKEDKKVETVAAALPVVDYSSHATKAAGAKGGNWEITVYEKVALGNGNQSNNPWLMELPDPISKVTWDNYITMHPEDVKTGGYKEMLRQDRVATLADITVNGVTKRLPVFPQPGQAKGTVGIALGYGRVGETLKVANGIGVNAFEMLSWTNDTIQPISSEVTIANVNEDYDMAATQVHHTIMGREEFLLRETSLKQYKEDPASNNPKAFLPTHSGPRPVGEVDLWNKHERPGHLWAMAIDLNSCFGCGACVVACTVENNVAVVGKSQVINTREMHWLRIDRYYTSDMDKVKAAGEGVGAMDMYLQMESPSNNPKVTFQPMMCQHCNHAPCESVCPVLATSHSTEGVNQMTYNRCIGTRYCANNCPFKVRRFNWFNYNENPDFAMNPVQDDLGRMVMNPDVTVRGRGVMEKCSMCAQRTQAGKLEAKKAGAPLVDGAIKMACQQSCPTNAIVFGDANDPNSEVSKLRADERNYYLLDELGVKPNVSYLVKVRNQEEEIVWEAEEAPKKDEVKKEEKHA
ncbi:MAG: TAT-variant-translocated molybdopterin oxidoreductase [Bacteroidota bacterium]|nr:TAT-variant-translocated molybdopterin oxidoreductase [Bacteroidota bacterium]